MYRMYHEGPSVRASQPSSRPSAKSGADGDWRAPLAKLVRNRPLFEHRSSLEALENAAHLPRPRAVSLGLGLCAPQSVSRGVPLDVLSMLLSAEALREALDAEPTVVLIADAHAVASGLPAADVTAQADAVEAAVRRAAERCALQLQVLRASELHTCPDHREVHAEVLDAAGPSTPPYVSLETADTETLRRRHGSLLKLGWSLGGSGEGVRDERFFDARYTRWVGDRTAFVYVKAGRTLSPSQPRTAPYVVADPNCRPLIVPGEDVEGKLARAAAALPHDRFRAVAKHYGHIVSAYASRSAPLRGELAQRLEGLLTHFFAASASSAGREAAE